MLFLSLDLFSTFVEKFGSKTFRVKILYKLHFEKKKKFVFLQKLKEFIRKSNQF